MFIYNKKFNCTVTYMEIYLPFLYTFEWRKNKNKREPHYICTD